MKTHNYFTLLVLLPLLMLCKHQVLAQAMKGTYTISSSGNYTTIMAAVSDLKTKGIKGSVVFKISPGTYDEKIEFTQISGASDTSTITFESTSNDSTKVILTNSKSTSTQNWVVYLNGVDYLTLRKLKIQPYVTSAYRRCIVIENEANNNKILNCCFISSSNTELILSSGSNDNNFEIRNSYFKGPNVTSLGIKLYGTSSSSLESGLVIENNVFVNGGVTVKYGTNIKISSNNSSYGGISLQNCDNPFIINRNRLINGSISLSYGVINTSFSEITNNYFKEYGIVCFQDNVKIYNNTVISRARSCFEFVNYKNIYLKNNILILTTSSGSMKGVYYFYSSFPSNHYFDFNNLLGTPIGFNYGPPNYTYSTLSSWRSYSGQDYNSISQGVTFAKDSMHILDFSMRVGIPLTEVTTDIDGQPRDPSQPFLGCDEYYPDILPDDTVICPGNSYTIVTQGNFSTIFWSTGQSGSSITVDSSGVGLGTKKIIVTASYGSYTYKDSINVKFQAANANAGLDKDICQGSNVTLNGAGGVSYLWMNYYKTQNYTLKPSKTIDCFLQVTDKYGCKDYDTVRVNVHNFPVVKLGKDTSFCEGKNINLVAGTDSTFQYVWKYLPNTDTISNSDQINVDSSGRYMAVVSSYKGCDTRDTIKITVNPNPLKPTIATIGKSEFCEGDSIQMIAPSGFKETNWTNGQKSSSFYVRQTDSIALRVVDMNGCESPLSDSLFVLVFPLPPKPTILNSGKTEFCKGDSVILSAPVGYPVYLWSDKDISAQKTVTKSGKFSVVVTDSNACVSPNSEEEVVTVYPLPLKPIISIQGKTEFCEGDSVILLSPTGYSVYHWSDGNSMEKRTIKNSKTISLQVEDSNSCLSPASDEVKTTLKTRPLKPLIQEVGTDSLQSSITASKYYWFLDDTLMTPITRLIVAPRTGNYQLILEDDACFSDSSDSYHHIHSFISEDGNISEIIIYPNPGKGKYIIESAKPLKGKIGVYDNKGQLILQQHISSNQSLINLENFATGLYLFQITTDEGSWVERVVKE